MILYKLNPMCVFSIGVVIRPNVLYDKFEYLRIHNRIQQNIFLKKDSMVIRVLIITCSCNGKPSFL